MRTTRFLEESSCGDAAGGGGEGGQRRKRPAVDFSGGAHFKCWHENEGARVGVR
jgi:hypothetical protein